MSSSTHERGKKQPIEWSSQLATGNQEIDSQHKELFARINKFILSSQNQSVDVNELSKLMKFMQSYVNLHFATEEALMRKHNFPGEALHKSQHEQFKTRVAEINAQLLKEGATVSLICNAHGLLVGWLSGHVQTMDRKLAEFLKDKK